MPAMWGIIAMTYDLWPVQAILHCGRLVTNYHGCNAAQNLFSFLSWDIITCTILHFMWLDSALVPCGPTKCHGLRSRRAATQVWEYSTTAGYNLLLWWRRSTCSKQHRLRLLLMQPVGNWSFALEWALLLVLHTTTYKRRCIEQLCW